MLREHYFLRTLRYNPVTATYLGADGYDPSLADVNGRLRDYSEATIGEEVAFYRQVARELNDLPVPPDGSTEAADRAILAAQLAFLIRQYGEQRYHLRAVDTYVAEPFRGVDWQIQQMTDSPDGLGTDGEWQLVVRRLRAIPGYLATAAANVAAGARAGIRADWRMIERDGIAGSRDNAAYFRTTLPDEARQHLGSRAFAGARLAEITAAGEAAGAAFLAFASALEALPSDRTDRFAAGEVNYEWRVHNNLHVNRSAAELWEYGAQQVSLYEGKIFDVARALAGERGVAVDFSSPSSSRSSVRRVLEDLGRTSPRDDDQLLAWYVSAGERAVAYGRSERLFDIPAEYRLDVVLTPPVLRSSIDAAYYPAPPFKTTGVGRFYLTPTGNNAAALREQNRASIATTAVHEGFPGHDWHYKYMSQHARQISNIRWLTPGAVEDSSSMWEDSMAAEGWALYAEELMATPVEGKPYGFYDTGEYLYMLQAQLMRAVRVRVDVGLHTGRMGFDEAVDYFATHVLFSPGARAARASDPAAAAIFDSADRAIYRYSKWPTQAITYNLGKNEIIVIRDLARSQQGSAFSLRRFHETLMRQGTVPVGYVRDALLAPAGTSSGG